LPDEPTTPLTRLVATADFGNGVSAALPFEDYLFINADLTIHLWRHPQGEWIGLDAQTLLASGGIGTAESVLHDVSGPVGRAFQTLVVQPRGQDPEALSRPARDQVPQPGGWRAYRPG